VQREEDVVGLFVDKGLAREHELRAQQERKGAADDEGNQTGIEVKEPDAFMVNAREP